MISFTISQLQDIVYLHLVDTCNAVNTHILSAVRIFEALSRKQITEKEEKVKSGLKEIITRAETVKEQTQACLCKSPLSLMAVLISC